MKVEFLNDDNNMHYVHGTIAFLAPRGFGVMLDPAQAATDGPSRLIPADGVAGFVLERDVVGNTTQAEQNALLINAGLGDSNFIRPYIVGSTVSGRKITRMEAEGADVILTSGTGAVDGNTAVNTELGYSAGRLRVKQGGDEIAFILRAQLPAQDPDNNNFRLLLERP
jgi:hypothetical protein